MTGRGEREEKADRKKKKRIREKRNQKGGRTGRGGGEYEQQMQKRAHEKKRAFNGCSTH